MTVRFGSPTVSGNVQVSVSNEIATPSSTQDVVSKSYIHSGTGVEDLYTVTTGKTFYLFGMTFRAGSSSASLKLFKNDGTTRIFHILNAGSTAGGNSSTIYGGGSPIAVYTTAQIVKVQSIANQETSIWGIEE